MGEREQSYRKKEVKQKLNFGNYSIYFSVIYGLAVKWMELHCRLESLLTVTTRDYLVAAALCEWVQHTLSRPTSYVRLLFESLMNVRNNDGIYKRRRMIGI